MLRGTPRNWCSWCIAPNGTNGVGSNNWPLDARGQFSNSDQKDFDRGSARPCQLVVIRYYGRWRGHKCLQIESTVP